MVILLEVMGSDRAIAESAWTSSSTFESKSQRPDEDVERLVPMLIRQEHSTPIESVVFRWWIKMPTAVDREFMTHRLQSANGMSARYRTLPREWQGLPLDAYQILKRIDTEKAKDIAVRYDSLFGTAFDLYESTLKLAKQAEQEGAITNREYKRIRDCIRMVIPVGNLVERISTMNLRAFANFYRLRSNRDFALAEIADVADGMLRSIKEYNEKNERGCPIAIRTLEEVGWRI